MDDNKKILNYLESIDSIDHDKWSRQIRTYGLEITKILSKLKILVVGLSGYGVEIAKNIIGEWYIHQKEAWEKGVVQSIINSIEEVL